MSRIISFLVCLMLYSFTLTAFVPFAVFVPDANVLNYGAVGDGNTNDRAAIQRAIDAVKGTGGKVTVPSGYTFLTGDLTLGSKMTFEVNGTLKKSNNPSHFAHPANYGLTVPNSRWQYNAMAYRNYPLIYSPGGTTDITVQGFGSLDMNWTGDYTTNISVIGVGFDHTSNFTIKDITVTNQSIYHFMIVGCNYGDISHVKTTNPRYVNTDGINIFNSQHIKVHGCNLTCNDDQFCIIATGPEDSPIYGYWCSVDPPQASYDIECYGNTFNSIGNGAGIVFFPWGPNHFPQSEVTISDINIHDNILLNHSGALNNQNMRYEEYTPARTMGGVPFHNIAIYNNRIGSSWNCTGWNSDIPKPDHHQLRYTGYFYTGGDIAPNPAMGKWREFFSNTSGGLPVAVTGVSLNPTSRSIAVGATTQLTATVSPPNASNKNVTWSSSNPLIAGVNASGLVRGVAEGSATITVTTHNSLKTASAAVTVTGPVRKGRTRP